MLGSDLEGIVSLIENWEEEAIERALKSYNETVQQAEEALNVARQ